MNAQSGIHSLLATLHLRTCLSSRATPSMLSLRRVDFAINGSSVPLDVEFDFLALQSSARIVGLSLARDHKDINEG